MEHKCYTCAFCGAAYDKPIADPDKSCGAPACEELHTFWANIGSEDMSDEVQEVIVDSEAGKESRINAASRPLVSADPAADYTDRTGRYLSLEERMQERRVHYLNNQRHDLG